jgi:hypothetical protein
MLGLQLPGPGVASRGHVQIGQRRSLLQLRGANRRPPRLLGGEPLWPGVASRGHVQIGQRRRASRLRGANQRARRLLGRQPRGPGAACARVSASTPRSGERPDSPASGAGGRSSDRQTTKSTGIGAWRRQVQGFTPAALLATARLIGDRSPIAAGAPSEPAAGAIESALLTPPMFFAGPSQPGHSAAPPVIHQLASAHLCQPPARRTHLLRRPSGTLAVAAGLDRIQKPGAS